MRSFVVLGAVVVLALAGCSGQEPRPSTLPPLGAGEPSAAASAATTEEADSTPAAGESAVEGHSTATPDAGQSPASADMPPTARGASAFARYYLKVLTEAYQTADSSQLRALSGPGCGGCNNLLAAIDGAAEVGESVSGGTFDVHFAEAPPLQDSETIVEVRYSRTPGIVVTRSQEGPLVPADPPIDAQMLVKHGLSGWQVLGFRATPR